MSNFKKYIGDDSLVNINNLNSIISAKTSHIITKYYVLHSQTKSDTDASVCPEKSLVNILPILTNIGIPPLTKLLDNLLKLLFGQLSQETLSICPSSTQHDCV